MDWALAIERNRISLGRVVAAIAALIGGREGAGLIARGARSAALALLRPAESAARRLIVIAARGLEVWLGPARQPPVLAGASRDSQRRTGRLAAFPLFERPLRFAQMVRAAPRGVPRIRSFWGPPSALPVNPPPAPAPTARPDAESLVESARLRLRLARLEAALADLPRQARRLTRWRARRGVVKPHASRSPLRIGAPPGQRRRPGRDVDELLGECHALALDALRADTS